SSRRLLAKMYLPSREPSPRHPRPHAGCTRYRSSSSFRTGSALPSGWKSLVLGRACNRPSAHANAVVLALDARHLSSKAVLQHLVFMRKHLHGFLIGKKILQVVQDEDANALLRVVHALQPFTEPLHDVLKCVLLDEVEEPLFGFEVVVHPG